MAYGEIRFTADKRKPFPNTVLETGNRSIEISERGTPEIQVIETEDQKTEALETELPIEFLEMINQIIEESQTIEIQTGILIETQAGRPTSKKLNINRDK